jgi:hypothetical protein
MNKREPILLNEVIEQLLAIQVKYGSDLVVQVAGKNIENITPIIWSPVERAENGEDLLGVVLIETQAS